MQGIYSELESYALEYIHPDASEETRALAQETEEQLLALLSPAQRTVYDACRSAELDYCSEYESAIFRTAFRLGAQFMCDILAVP